ncbi:hypothetical protein [Streptomyces sp. NPDC047043]|uniref:hypothetical protein n=1 Tax=Streptomyces sp. NPDC047043 TaxID=3154497 RepID=UPI0033D89996
MPEDLAVWRRSWCAADGCPRRDNRREWAGAKEVRAAVIDFRRNAFGLSPAGTRMGEEIAEGEGVQLTLDTQTDTYEQAIAAVQAAYGLNTAAVAGSWPDAPAHEPRPDPADLSGEDLREGWTDRPLFDTVAAVMPGARAVLRRVVEVGGTASDDDIREHFIAPLRDTDPAGEHRRGTDQRPRGPAQDRTGQPDQGART